MKSELYYDNMITSWFSDPLQQFIIDVNSKLGAQLSDKYQFIPNSAGKDTVKFELRYGS